MGKGTVMDVQDMENAISWREHVENRFDGVDEHLRTISDRLGLILTILAPDEQDGPTLDDLLAKLATLISEQRPILRRVDNTTGATLDILEGRRPRGRSEDEGEGAVP